MGSARTEQLAAPRASATKMNDSQSTLSYSLGNLHPLFSNWCRNWVPESVLSSSASLNDFALLGNFKILVLFIFIDSILSHRGGCLGHARGGWREAAGACPAGLGGFSAAPSGDVQPRAPVTPARCVCTTMLSVRHRYTNMIILALSLVMLHRLLVLIHEMKCTEYILM